MSDTSTFIDKLTDSCTILFLDHLTLDLKKNQCSSNLCLFVCFFGFVGFFNELEFE